MVSNRLNLSQLFDNEIQFRNLNANNILMINHEIKSSPCDI
jgi:hypothetical protein